LSRRIRVESLELVTHCHATEDPEKVKQALLNLLPPDLRNRVAVHEQRLSGYFHNPIVRMQIVLHRDEALESFRYVLCRLPEYDRRYLLLSLEQRYDRRANKLFLRVDKQEAYMGRIALNEGSDTIRLSVSFSLVRSIDEVRSLLESLCKGSEDASGSTGSSERS